MKVIDPKQEKAEKAFQKLQEDRKKYREIIKEAGGIEVFVGKLAEKVAKQSGKAKKPQKSKKSNKS